jgi:hypothetical protein
MSFNKAIHLDAFSTPKMPEKVIITITDDSKAFLVSTIVSNDSATSTVNALSESLVQNIWLPRNNLFQTREGTRE